MKIDISRYNELIDKEKQLDALHAGGVDNWEFYDVSLEPYFQEKEFEEKIEESFTDLLEILCEGIEEPAGRGAGYGFDYITQEKALVTYKETVKELKKSE